MGEYLVEQKIMPREQVPLQQWHTLTQAVGVGKEPAADKKYVDLKTGDLLLICSDGLTDMLTDEEIAGILPPSPLSSPSRGEDGSNSSPPLSKDDTNSSPPLRGGDKGEGDINKLADSLVAEANKRGGRDNISVVLVQQI